MDKLRMQTANKADENFKKLAAMFPNAVTETINENGEVVRAIDKDVLMQEINTKVVDGKEERYQFTWPDKKKSVLLANAPINKTLRPCREESVDFDTTENLYIEGDNLEVLKLLQETYLGKIKMIYIDPPYNTGNDFVYEDDFAQSTEEYLANSGQFDEDGNRMVQNTESNGRFHTDWLNMMYTRLRIAKDLLADDGIIFLSIDNNEYANLKMICDEVFGGRNFISTLTVENNPKGRKNNAFIAESYEYCLIYAKNKSYIYDSLSKADAKKFFKGVPNTEDTRKALTDRYGEFKQSRRQVSGTGKSNAWARISNPDRCFTIYYKDGDEEKMELLDEYDKLNDKWVVSSKGEALLQEGYTRYCCFNNVDMKPAIPLYSKTTLRQLFYQHSLYFKDDGTIYEKDRDNTQQITSMLTNKKFGLDLMTESATAKMEKLFGVKDIFTNSKAIDFIKAVINLYPANDMIVLDFFSGSATTAHAVISLNAEDGGKRKWIMVQIPETTDKTTAAHKAGYKTICEIGKERIRRAGQKIQEERIEAIALSKHEWDQTTFYAEHKEECDRLGHLPDEYFAKEHPPIDTGFRVLKCDTSNMKEVYYNPAEYEASLFSSLEDNIKEDRTPEDLLFQVMLDLGVLLSSKIEETTIAGKKVFNVEDNYLIACFDSDVTEETIKAIAKQKPYYFVMRDSSMASDSVATNFDQIFATYSPDTVRKVL